MNPMDLTPEQQEKLKACKAPEELIELAKQEGYELSDAELEGIAGGSWCINDCNGLSEKCKSWHSVVW